MSTEYLIVGESKPNKVVLFSPKEKATTELPKRQARIMLENGLISIENPDRLYVKI